MNGRNRNHLRQVFARSRNEPPSLSPSEPRPPFGKASHGPRLVRRAARVLRSSISDRGRCVAAGATRRRRSNMTNLRIRRPPFFNVRLWVGFADFAVRLLPPRALRPRARATHHPEKADGDRENGVQIGRPRTRWTSIHCRSGQNWCRRAIICSAKSPRALREPELLRLMAQMKPTRCIVSVASAQKGSPYLTRAGTNECLAGKSRKAHVNIIM